MRADEFVVERYIEAEKKLLKKDIEIEELEEQLEEVKEELADYTRLVYILSKYLKPSEGSFYIYISKYCEEEKLDIEFLENFFHIEHKQVEEENEEENQDEVIP